MSYFLDERFGLAVCGRDLVILDCTDGEYSLAPGAGRHIALRGEQVEIDEAALAHGLLSAGVVQPRRPAMLRSVLPALPTRSAFDLSHPPCGVAGNLALLIAGSSMPFRFHPRSFSGLLAQARRAAQGIERDVEDRQLLALASRFDQVSPWAPWQGECLFRSFMLLSAAQRLGYAPRWVFGVRTWPFSAHCWLQVGEVALTDYAEVLAPYTPILAI